MWKVAPFYYFHCVVSYIRLLSAIPNSKTIAKLNVIILFSDVKHETLKAIATQTSFSSVELVQLHFPFFRPLSLCCCRCRRISSIYYYDGGETIRIDGHFSSPFSSYFSSLGIYENLAITSKQLMVI